VVNLYALSVGRTDEAKRCAERLSIIRARVHKEFYQQDKGDYLFSSQSSLAMALYARIPPPELRSKILARLENQIVVEKQGHLESRQPDDFQSQRLKVNECLIS
jgi:alpha-L-rhamnosidase